MNKTGKSIRIVSILLAIQTVTWIVFTLLSMSDVKPDWDIMDYVKWVAEPDIFFTGNYINATFMTLFIITLFALIFNYFHLKYKNLSIIAFAFIPIYGLLNIICYSIQIRLVPLISLNAMNNPEALFFASQLQANNSTLIGFLNGLAYAILGIPSIIFGLLLKKENKRYSGFFLFFNGILCILGIVGHMINNRILEFGIAAGGVVFLISVVFMAIEFKDIE